MDTFFILFFGGFSSGRPPCNSLFLFLWSKSKPKSRHRLVERLFRGILLQDGDKDFDNRLAVDNKMFP